MYFRNPQRALIIFIAAAIVSFSCHIYSSVRLLVAFAGHGRPISIGGHELSHFASHVIFFFAAIVFLGLGAFFVYLAKQAWPRLVELRREQARKDALREMSLSDFQRTMKLAQEEFEFLLELEFILSEKKEPTGESHKDGWILTYTREPLEVDVRYLGAEFEVEFRLGEAKATYLLLDRFLFEGASGYGGCMFSGEKLEKAIRNIANDIKTNYSKVLKGDNEVWDGIREHTRSLDIWEKLYTDKRGTSFS